MKNKIDEYKPLKTLGKYIWINIHTNNNEHYMVFGFPDKIKENITVKATSYLYLENKDVPIKSDCTVILKKIININQSDDIIVQYPTTFVVDIIDQYSNTKTYEINSTVYGNCVTVDFTNNLHWSGSANLIDYITRENMGDSFVELNHFQNIKDYTKTMLLNTNIDISNINLFIDPPLSIIDVSPSLLYIIGIIIMFLIFIINLIKLIN